MAKPEPPSFGGIADRIQGLVNPNAPLERLAYDAGEGPEPNQLSVFPFSEVQLSPNGKNGGETGIRVIYKNTKGLEVTSRIVANQPFFQRSVLPVVHYDFQRKPNQQEMIEFNTADAAVAYKMVQSFFQYRCQVRMLDRFSTSAELSGYLAPNLPVGCTMEYEPLRAGVKRFVAAASYPLKEWCPCFKNGGEVVGRFDAKEGPSLHLRVPIKSCCPCAASYEGVLLAETRRLVVGLHTASCRLMDKWSLFATISKDQPLLSFLATKTVSKNVKVNVFTQAEITATGPKAPKVGIRITN